MVAVERTTGPLGIDPDDLSKCVGCGLCLPHCPTFRVTGEEGFSPRGRIDAMRAVEWRGAPIDDTFMSFVETCVQCRGCEPACPSGVPYGRLIERTNETLARERRITPWWQRAGMGVLFHHRMLLAGSSLLALAQRLRLVPRRLGLARLPLRRGRLPESAASPDVWLFTGCVMDAWLRATHRATAAVVAAAGGRAALTGGGAACCGALHAHAGLHDAAAKAARTVIAAIPGDAPILVNSAGCGAMLKEYGELLGTDEARHFAARVVDVHEWLAARVEALPPAAAGARRSVVVQDPCHLRHVQRAEGAVRTVLRRYFDVVELPDDGVCCGAGGAYSVRQPELAGKIRARKVGVIEEAERRYAADVVASANPGCAMHLAAGGVTVAHPLDLVAEAIEATRRGAGA